MRYANLFWCRLVLMFICCPTLPPAASAAMPEFGALDEGSMPRCLLELSPRIKEAGWVLNAGTPYTVWAAPKKVGQQYYDAAWRPFGPQRFESRQRYLFNWDGAVWGGNFANDPVRSISATVLSPAYAAMGVHNHTGDPVWIIVNPLPPGCREGSPPAQSHASIGGTWRGIWEARGINQDGYRIQQQGNQLTFISADGAAKSSGYFKDADTIVAKEWQATGTISNQGNTIRWDNGSHWERGAAASGSVNISGIWRGIWEARGINTYGYAIQQNGSRLTFISSDGVTKSSGYFKNPTTVVAEEWKAIGTITNNGNSIRWDNGSHWER